MTGFSPFLRSSSLAAISSICVPEGTGSSSDHALVKRLADQTRALGYDKFQINIDQPRFLVATDFVNVQEHLILLLSYPHCPFSLFNWTRSLLCNTAGECQLHPMAGGSSQCAEWLGILLMLRLLRVNRRHTAPRDTRWYFAPSDCLA
jgi:hypothetical protein